MKFNLNNNTQLKKMVRSSSITTTTTTTSDCLTHNDFLVYEILTRLPVKTLFRFKSVSKEWSSLIEKDQNFIHSHLLTHSKTHHPCRIFIVVPVPLTKKERKKIMDSEVEIDHWPYKEFNITADLVFEDNNGTTPMKAVVDTVREVDSTYYDIVTKPPVNGLFCSIETQLKHDVRICNISTQQVSKSFRTTLLEEPKYDKYGNCCYALKYSCESFHYGFGFDHATNEHKLVCVWRVQPHDDDDDDDGGDDPHCFICEVLTLGIQGGINCWRRINDVPPPYTLTDDSNDSVYVNGFIYWSTYHRNSFLNSIFGPITIVAFDVGREKFRTIIVPDLILGEAAYYFRDDSCYDRHVSLLEVNGSLAMLIRGNRNVFKMYIYEDDDYKKEEEEGINRASTSTSFPSNNKERWIEVRSISSPLDLVENRVTFHTFVGSDDKIIATFYDRRGCGKKIGKNKCLSFYCFNWKKDSWTEFEVSGIPSSVPHICYDSSFTTFFPSLLPVNN